jgi:hypothetical protein
MRALDTTPQSRGSMRPSCAKHSPRNERAQGRPGARCTRGLMCKMHKAKRTRAYRFSGGSPAFPAQWFYGLFHALPGDRLSCHRRSQEALASQELDTSVGASGPHDFAVRSSAFVTHATASTASHPNVRDDGQRPSEGRDGGAYSSESSARGRANCPTGNAIVMHRFSSWARAMASKCLPWVKGRHAHPEIRLPV